MDDIPHFPELTVRNMWKDLKNNKYFMSYMPTMPEGKFPPKEYFYNVLNTVFDNCIPRLV